MTIWQNHVERIQMIQNMASSPTKYPNYLVSSSMPRKAADNLYAEELLLQWAQLRQCAVFFLYRNVPSVVFGKFQNPWMEINLPFTMQHQIPCIRRISGGGTVYHDDQNINWCFIQPKTHFDKFSNLQFLADALLWYGFEVQITDRGDMLVSGKKISGNALCYKSGMVLHHGTLLVASDRQKLRQSLDTTWNSSLQFTSKSILSNRMSVMNLSETDKSLTAETVMMHIADQFSKKFSGIDFPEHQDFLYIHQHGIFTEREKYNTYAWNYGSTPEFSATLSTMDATVTIENGCVSIETLFGERLQAGTDFMTWLRKHNILPMHETIMQGGFDGSP